MNSPNRRVHRGGTDRGEGSPPLHVVTARVPRDQHLLSPTLAGSLFEMPAPSAPIHADNWQIQRLPGKRSGSQPWARGPLAWVAAPMNNAQVSVALLGAVLAACDVPARRASVVDPMIPF